MSKLNELKADDFVEGSLALAHIIFVHLKEKDTTESFNDFILKLFNDGIIKVGSVKSEYEKAIAQIKSNVD